MAISDLLSGEHRIAMPAFVNRASVAFGGHVVEKTTLGSKSFATFLAPEMVLCLQVRLQLRYSAETVAADLTCRPMTLLGHVKNSLLVVEKMFAASITLVQRAVNHALGNTTGRRHLE